MAELQSFIKKLNERSTKLKELIAVNPYTKNRNKICYKGGDSSSGKYGKDMPRPRDENPKNIDKANMAEIVHINIKPQTREKALQADDKKKKTNNGEAKK